MTKTEQKVLDVLREYPHGVSGKKLNDWLFSGRKENLEGVLDRMVNQGKLVNIGTAYYLPKFKKNITPEIREQVRRGKEITAALVASRAIAESKSTAKPRVRSTSAAAKKPKVKRESWFKRLFG